MRKEPDYDYDKQNISVVISNRYPATVSQVMAATIKLTSSIASLIAGNVYQGTH